MRNIFFAVATTLALALPAMAKSSAAEVQCTDGSTGKAGRGACSRHGGVAKGAPSNAEALPDPTANERVAPGRNAPAAQARTRTQSRDSQDQNAPAERKGSVLGKIFGRRDSSDTPRSSTREAPAGKAPMATCKDGTTSYSAHHSGTCSGHGGVQQWLDK